MYPVSQVWEDAVLGQSWLPCVGYQGCVGFIMLNVHSSDLVFRESIVDFLEPSGLDLLASVCSFLYGSFTADGPDQVS